MNLDTVLEGLAKQLPVWLPKQRWFSSAEEAPTVARVVEYELFREASPMLLWMLVEVDGSAIYQIPVGLRERNDLGAVLLGRATAEIGSVNSGSTELVAYDALVDSVLCRVLFDLIAEGNQEVKTVRPIGAEQSNSSLVFDNRLILKIFRRLYEGANPDLEVTSALTHNGFKHVAPVVATWQRGNWDLAVCQPYLWDGTDGWKLALASVRDFFGAETTGASSPAGSPSGVYIDETDPASAGGDFGDEARRLGEVTAGLHLALANEFGSAPFDPSTLVASLQGELSSLNDAQSARLQAVIERVGELSGSNAGVACRIHGDFHLGQTLRSVSGWYVFDFEGEPARPLSERVRATSPLKDVSGMLRSFHYAAAVGISEQNVANQVSLRQQADAWELHNREAFRHGYLSVKGIDELLPTGEAASLLLRAFELEKALYELAYEKAYRPDWVSIPQAALRRLLA